MEKQAEQFIRAAVELQPLLREHAARIEQQRNVGADVIAAIDEAGLFGVIAPRRWGGAALPLAATARVCEELAKGDASASWVHYILSFGAWMVSLLPDEGQEEVFAKGVPRVCGVGGPPGAAQRSTGGYAISGRWGYASGCSYAQWAFLVATPDDKNPSPGGPPVDIVGVAPMSEVTIEDTWFVSGMCGTGSNTLVAKNVFIPDRRILQFDPQGGPGGPTGRHFGEGSDFWPFWPTITGAAAGPMVGMAQRVLELVSENVGKRGITYTSYEHQSDSQVVVREIAEAAVKIECARGLLQGCAAEVDRAGAERRKMPELDRARFRGQIAYLSGLLRQTVDGLMSITGASGFALASPLQRYWRDLGMLSRHAFLSTNPGLEVYGRALLGLRPIGPM